MINRLVILFICVLTSTNVLHAQNINSPYSLFGLGAENDAAAAGLSGMGNSGIANSTYNQVNLFNPASLGNISSQTFLQEFGVNGFYSTLKNSSTTESNYKANISHLAFAFSAKRGWGIGFGLLPYSTTGYTVDIEKSVEGSEQAYINRITGTGGINKFYISSGTKIGSKLSLGLDFSVLFGSIDQDSQLFVANTPVSIEQTSFYKGVRLSTGVQYDLFSNKKSRTTIGATVDLPTVLTGRRTTSSYKNTNTIIEDVEETDLKDFEYPLAVGIGVSSFYNQVRANFDYKRTFWSDTNQNLNDETYVNQTMYAIGFEYQNIKKYQRIKYRAGLNYNTGFLEVSGRQVDSYFGSVGLGIPLNKQSSNMMNVSYSYGKEGTLDGGLIQETIHKITINLSLNGNWFRKRKIN